MAVSDLVMIRYQLASEAAAISTRMVLATRSAWERKWPKPWAFSIGVLAGQIEVQREDDPRRHGAVALFGGDEFPTPLHDVERGVVEFGKAAGAVEEHLDRRAVGAHLHAQA